VSGAWRFAAITRAVRRGSLDPKRGQEAVLAIGALMEALERRDDDRKLTEVRSPCVASRLRMRPSERAPLGSGPTPTTRNGLTVALTHS
jgi:hypothetical protein